ncbi:aminodeoxychorismate/anthranilate synthase component II [Ekhidna sp.]|jgi:anthranilate synthase component 2|uniref:anthranilate synthase component II n=1 Tax=Ekhidna sp. TaxID=2608089 RepID=UPI0032EB6B4A
MKVLVIDNYDSFTYNLVHILRELGIEESMRVVRNDQFELNEVESFDHILLSPGPGLPREAGLMPKVIDQYAPTKNILGVCLGHQAIGEAFGAKLLNLPQVFHGMVTPVEITENDELFKGLPTKFNVCRYHSWVIEKGTLPKSIKVTSVAENGNIMSIKHEQYDVRGVQFHPESIMTEYGKQLMKNWLGL